MIQKFPLFVLFVGRGQCQHKCFSRSSRRLRALNIWQSSHVPCVYMCGDRDYDWEWPRQADGTPFVPAWAELRDEGNAIKALAFGDDEGTGL